MEISQFIKDVSVIMDKYTVLSRLGSGAHGVVLKVRNNETKVIYAMKVSPHVHAHIETAFLHILNGSRGIPRVYDFNTDYFNNGDNYYGFIVMDMLKKDIYSIWRENNYTFSLRTILMIMINMLSILCKIHRKGILHRDLKPENMLLGRDHSEIHLVDFGMANFYRDPDTGMHKSEDEVPVTNKYGTPMYWSPTSGEGFQQGRRDDMISLSYILLDFVTRNNLPWSKCFNLDRSINHDAMQQMKLSLTGKQVFDGHPEEFQIFYDYVRCIPFDGKPRYKSIMNMFLKLFRDKGFTSEGGFIFDDMNN